MISCHNEKHLQKIPTLKTQCIILNLEDGVSSEQKTIALRLCAKYLDIYKDIDKMFVVRVNALDDGGLEDIQYLNNFKPDAIRVPKIKTKDDVSFALDIIDDDIELHLSIETALAWKNMTSLKINSRVTTFYLGVLDLFADMNLPHSIVDKDNKTMQYILTHFLITTLSLGVKPVSFIYQDYKKLDEFKSWLYLEKEMGYRAKGCISPDQTLLVDKIFLNDDLEIIKAKKIIELFEKQKKAGITGFVDAKLGFIDEPIYKGALALLSR